MIGCQTELSNIIAEINEINIEVKIIINTWPIIHPGLNNFLNRLIPKIPNIQRMINQMYTKYLAQPVKYSNMKASI